MSTSTVDSKKRIVLPGGEPGDVFDIQPKSDGQYLLVKLQNQKPAGRMSKKACSEAMRQAPLQPKIYWESLRDLTREP